MSGQPLPRSEDGRPPPAGGRAGVGWHAHRRQDHGGVGAGEVGDAALIDLVDRLLTGGVVLAGDVTLALAGVDLVHVSIRALVSAVETLESGGRRR